MLGRVELSIKLVRFARGLMQSKHSLTRFMSWSTKMAGKPFALVGAVVVFLTWFTIGLIYGFSPTWMLVINTIATLNASFMVFIIQNTQNRESRALHTKIDELIRVTEKAEKALIDLEEGEEAEIEKIRDLLREKVR